MCINQEIKNEHGGKRKEKRIPVSKREGTGWPEIAHCTTKACACCISANPTVYPGRLRTIKLQANQNSHWNGNPKCYPSHFNYVLCCKQLPHHKHKREVD